MPEPNVAQELQDNPESMDDGLEEGIEEPAPAEGADLSDLPIEIQQTIKDRMAEMETKFADQFASLEDERAKVREAFESVAELQRQHLDLENRKLDAAQVGDEPVRPRIEDVDFGDTRSVQNYFDQRDQYLLSQLDQKVKTAQDSAVEQAQRTAHEAVNNRTQQQYNQQFSDWQSQHPDWQPLQFLMQAQLLSGEAKTFEEAYGQAKDMRAGQAAKKAGDRGRKQPDVATGIGGGGLKPTPQKPPADVREAYLRSEEKLKKAGII
jgi:hypothetical protein